MKLQYLVRSPFCGVSRQRLTSLTVVLCLALAACASEPAEWIDVPLVDNTHFDVSPEYRADEIEISIPANSDLEYMLDMKQGYSVSYKWNSADISDPELLLAEFHGHTIRLSDEPGEVMFYKQGRGEAASGYLAAPSMVCMVGIFPMKPIAIFALHFRFPVSTLSHESSGSGCQRLTASGGRV